MKVPVRVDFAGGWLDVPKLARKDGVIVNCAVSPLVSKASWPYAKNSGIGGSAAWSLLEGHNPFTTELGAGVGWQDPAIIMETGLCAWASGPQAKLLLKADPSLLLAGRMALLWRGGSHVTADLVDKERDYNLIADAGKLAYMAIRLESVDMLRQSIELSYSAQIQEGMENLPIVTGAVRKYCGSGWGGYALYYFAQPEKRNAWLKAADNGVDALAVEPVLMHRWEGILMP